MSPTETTTSRLELDTEKLEAFGMAIRGGAIVADNQQWTRAVTVSSAP